MMRRVLALVSGGKDSCYSMLQCVAEGHQIVALANLKPIDKHENELDSYMYQTVGHEAIDLYAEAMNLPLFRGNIRKGSSVNTDSTYTLTANDEVEDLYNLLKRIREEKGHDFFSAVCSGAILSDYQRVRVEHVCARLGLVSLSYLWRRDQSELLDEMIDSQVNSVVVKVATLGLNQNHLGKSLGELRNHLHLMSSKYGINICGEGGEFETFTLDCPLFFSSIQMDEKEVIAHSHDDLAPVALLKIKKASLKPKFGKGDFGSQQEMLKGIPIKVSMDHCKDVLKPVSTENPPSEKIGSIEKSINECFHCKDGQVFSVSNITSSHSDPALAMKESFERLKEILKNHGLSAQDVTSVVLLVSNMANYMVINKEYVKHFKENPPVRVCVQSPINTPVSLSVVGKVSKEKKTMHVQSISHWAPANIGPYSQAADVGGILFTAGQVGLIPGTLELAEGAENQANISMRSLKRVLDVFGYSIANAKLAICYMNGDYQGIGESVWARESGPVKLHSVIMPGLPKNASVEWHVICSKIDNNRELEAASGDQIDETRFNRHFDGETLSCSTEVCLSSGNAFITVEFMGETGSIIDDQLIKDWKMDLDEAIEEVTGKNEVNTVLQCQLFKRPNFKFPMPNDGSVVHSLVPVNGFPKKNLVAVLSGHLKM